MNLGLFSQFLIFLISSHFSHFEWLVFGVSSELLYVVWWLFGLGFYIKIKVESDWQVFQAYSILFFVICQKWSIYDHVTFFPFYLKYPTI